MKKIKKKAKEILFLIFIINLLAISFLSFILTRKSNLNCTHFYIPEIEIKTQQTSDLGIIGNYTIQSRLGDIDYGNEIVYIVDNDNGFYSFNVSNPSSPILLGNISNIGNTQDIFIQNDIAYVMNSSSGINCYNVSNPSTPVFLGSCITPGYPHSVYVYKNVAYVAGGIAGMSYVNVSDPFNPNLIGNLNHANYARDVTIDNEKLYLIDSEDGNGVICYDISNPFIPEYISEFGIRDGGGNIVVSENIVYVGNMIGIYTINYSNPLYPTQLSVSPFGYRADDVEIIGDVIYMLESQYQDNGTIFVYDGREKENPILIDSIITPNSTKNIAVSGNIIYVTASFSGLQCIRTRNYTRELLRLYPPKQLGLTNKDESVMINWNEPKNAAVSPIKNYNIYRGTVSENRELLTTIGNITSFNDTGLSNGETYYYSITALNQYGESDHSSIAEGNPKNSIPGYLFEIMIPSIFGIIIWKIWKINNKVDIIQFEIPNS